jgi:hypothetical protein
MPLFARFILATAYCLTGSGMAMAGNGEGSTAVIPPFHDRENVSGIEGPVRMSRLSFTLFLYRDAVAVYEEADLVNTRKEPIDREISLPSGGTDHDGPAPDGVVSHGILGVRVWVDGERTLPKVITGGDDVSWYTVHTTFGRFETRKIKALFWTRTFPASADELPGLDSTVIARGPRQFTLDLSHAALWNGTIGKLDVMVLLQEGMDMESTTIRATPDTYEEYGTVLSWHRSNVEPSPTDDITVDYMPDDASSTISTMAQLARTVTREGYDDLLRTVEDMREP